MSCWQTISNPSWIHTNLQGKIHLTSFSVVWHFWDMVQIPSAGAVCTLKPVLARPGCIRALQCLLWQGPDTHLYTWSALGSDIPDKQNDAQEPISRSVLKPRILRRSRSKEMETQRRREGIRSFCFVYFPHTHTFLTPHDLSVRSCVSVDGKQRRLWSHTRVFTFRCARGHTGWAVTKQGETTCTNASQRDALLFA